MRNELLAAVEYFKSLLQTIADDEWNREARNSATAALSALRDALQRQPDPITGLVPCGCGGKAAVKKGVNHRSGYYVICDKCECNIGLDRDDYLRPYGAYPTEEQAMSDWNTAMSGGMCNHEN